MICNVVFRVGSELSLFSVFYPKEESREEFLEFALSKLIDMYSIQFTYMYRSIDSISQDINNEVVTIIGYFDDKFKFFSSCENPRFEFNDLDIFNDLKGKLNDKFHKGDLKRSNVKYAKKGDNVVKLNSDDDVKEYVKEMKGVKNEIQKD